MMMKPICALESLPETSRFTWRKTPPRGSSRTKLRNAPSLAMKRDCSHKVSPGAGATPPTITSPTWPPAWQVTTLMILEDRRVSTARPIEETTDKQSINSAAAVASFRPSLVHRIGRAPSASHQRVGCQRTSVQRICRESLYPGRVPNCIRTGDTETSRSRLESRRRT
jgi:hypothetical protein